MHGIRSRLGAIKASTVGLLTILSWQPAFAWKPVTHIYLAQQVLNDIADDGKVTIHRTGYTSGRELEVIGEYDVSPEILSAIRSNPNQFRAGVLGPDAFPDIVTGQQVIHPDDPDKRRPEGTNSWLKHLWDMSGASSGGSPASRAFVIGFLTHAAGDMYGHTFVNYYTGGAFKLGENAIKHIVLEGYVGKRTPRVTTNTNVEITENDFSIDGIGDFIYSSMIDARPGSALDNRLLVGAGSSLSVPKVFSNLKAGLVVKVNKYYESKSGYDRRFRDKAGERRDLANCWEWKVEEKLTWKIWKWVWESFKVLVENGACLAENARITARNIAINIELAAIVAEKGAFITANILQTTYMEEWIKDIDRGLRSWPAVSQKLAKSLVYSSDGTNVTEALETINEFKDRPNGGFWSMLGAPDSILLIIQGGERIAESILPTALMAAYTEMKNDLLKYLIKEATGLDIEEFKQYFKSPEIYFDKVLGSGSSGTRTTLSSFNREQLKIADSGYSNQALTYDYRQFPAAYNTVVMTKLLLLDSTGIKSLLRDLRSSNIPREANAMLGFIRTLDGDNQWRNTDNPGFMILAEDCGAYRQVFMRQVGERDGCIPVFNKEEAKTAIIGLYNSLLQRDPDQSEIDRHIASLEDGMTMEGIRRSIAFSPEAKEHIQRFYSDILLRLPTPEETSNWQFRLSSELTLAQVREGVANSQETRDLLSKTYMLVLDRPASADELAVWQGHLAKNKITKDVRRELANGEEAVSKIKILYRDITASSPTVIEIAKWQAMLANDTSLTDVRKSLASSQSAVAALRKLYQRVLGRSAIGVEVASWQAKLAVDKVLHDVRISLANSDESKDNIRKIYRRLVRREPSSDELMTWVLRLANGASLSDIERELKSLFFPKRKYKVQSGDNLSFMTQMFYGGDNPLMAQLHSSPHYFYRSIYSHNRQQLSNPDLIYPGQQLSVPFTSGQLTYRVRVGDSLAYIARMYYGDERLYRRIVSANPGLASSPGLIRPGQVLKIPYD